MQYRNPTKKLYSRNSNLSHCTFLQKITVNLKSYSTNLQYLFIALWSVQVEKVLYLEDVEKNLSAPPPFRTEFSDRNVYCHPLVQWYWECKCKSIFLKALACLTATLSFVVVWSELVFFNRHPVLSIFANVLTLLKYDFGTIEIFSMFTLFYLCYCAYSTIFRIKFFNLLYLSANHQTNEYSLIFSAMMLSRLTPPLCLNFLSLLHMDSHIIKQRIMETYYTQVMGIKFTSKKVAVFQKTFLQVTWMFLE